MSGKGSAIARGAARSGELLLAGLFRCGHCGQKMHVSYGSASRYRCNTGTAKSHASKRCISVAGISADQAVVAEVLRILKPLGGDAAVRALEVQSVETSAARRQFDLALTQARYEAAHARRQYDSVDPTNRLVASELERRWNAALEKIHRVEGEISALEAKQPRPLSEKEQQHLMMLGADLERAWSHPAAGVAARKRIIRAALHEIIVRIENGFVEMVLHWLSGDHTMLKFKMKTSGKYRYTISEDTLADSWRARYQTVRSRNCSIAPASRPGAAMAGPMRGFAHSVAHTKFQSTKRARGRRVGKSPWRLRRKSSVFAR